MKVRMGRIENEEKGSVKIEVRMNNKMEHEDRDENEKEKA